MKEQLKLSHFLICLTLVYSFVAASADTGTEPIDEVPEFKDYMMDHPFEGCPGGSKCLKITGQRRKAWSNLLKQKKNRLSSLENQRKKVGVPLAIWSYDVAPFPENLVKWNSPCEQHNKGEQKIFTAEILSSDFKNLSNQKHLIIRKSLLQEGSNLFTQYPTLRDESPIYISNKKLIYSLDLDGEYYAISVASDGNISMIEAKKPQRFPENVKCTDDMVKAFKNLEMPDQLYLGVSCRAIWDIEQQKFLTLISGWSCS